MVASDLVERLREHPCGAVLLDAVAPAGGDPLPGVHLVGGAVRDLVLRRPPRELDVVVEGDPAPLAERLGATSREHDRFGTVTVEAGDCRFDIVRARAESYAAPGALPDVRPGTLAEDLARRDLSINAIALSLPEGELESVPAALDDLEARVVRVLHDRSFEDDPTRLWRVARYAVRLGFAIDPRTAALAGEADPGTVSGARMGNEMRLVLAEPFPPAVFELARSLNPRLLPEGFEPRSSRLREALALLPPDGRLDLVVLGAAVVGLGVSELLGWLHDLEFTSTERDVIAAGSRPSTWRPLHEARTPAEIARAARGVPVEVVALAGGDNARRWIEELRHVALEIDGRDLLAAGVPEGPEIGRRLQVALDRKLDGTLEGGGREAELAAALR